MKRKLYTGAAIAITSLLFSSLPGLTPVSTSPGVIYELTTTYFHGQRTEIERTQFWVLAPDLLKIVTSARGQTSTGAPKDEVIFRGDRREIVMVDHANQTYSVMNEEALRAIDEQLAAGMEMMKGMEIPESVLKQMPGEQRKQLEDARKQMQPDALADTVLFFQPPPVSVYRNTGERDTIKGYPCVKYDVIRDGERVREMWVTKWNNLQGGTELREVFEEIEAFLKELSGTFENMIGGGGGGGLMDAVNDPFDGLTEVGGFPVITRDYSSGGVLVSETALESETRMGPLDPDTFEPPSGYRLRKMGPQ